MIRDYVHKFGSPEQLERLPISNKEAVL